MSSGPKETQDALCSKTRESHVNIEPSSRVTSAPEQMQQASTPRESQDSVLRPWI